MWPATVVIIAAVSLINFISSCAGHVWCYECAFGPSPAGVDVCRPGSLNVSSVHAVKCPQGCKISIVYEFEPNALQEMSPTQTSVRLTTNATWIGHKKNIEAITFVMRNCADKKLPRSGCEVKEFGNMHHEECYCFTDYCNGHDGAVELSSSFFSTFILASVTTAILLLAPSQLTNVYLLKTP